MDDLGLHPSLSQNSRTLRVFSCGVGSYSGLQNAWVVFRITEGFRRPQRSRPGHKAIVGGVGNTRLKLYEKPCNRPAPRAFNLHHPSLPARYRSPGKLNPRSSAAHRWQPNDFGDGCGGYGDFGVSALAYDSFFKALERQIRATPAPDRTPTGQTTNLALSAPMVARRRCGRRWKGPGSGGPRPRGRGRHGETRLAEEFARTPGDVVWLRGREISMGTPFYAAAGWSGGRQKPPGDSHRGVSFLVELRGFEPLTF